ncbi:hypothetical protein CLERM_213 [Coxiella-like endosymbiont]|nr:hypothetical protein CLERM_213 [Coxiella-like endosymbiont]
MLAHYEISLIITLIKLKNKLEILNSFNSIYEEEIILGVISP